MKIIRIAISVILAAWILVVIFEITTGNCEDQEKRPQTTPAERTPDPKSTTRNCLIDPVVWTVFATVVHLLAAAVAISIAAFTVRHFHPR